MMGIIQDASRASHQVPHYMQQQDQHWQQLWPHCQQPRQIQYQEELKRLEREQMKRKLEKKQQRALLHLQQQRSNPPRVQRKQKKRPKTKPQHPKQNQYQQHQQHQQLTPYQPHRLGKHQSIQKLEQQPNVQEQQKRTSHNGLKPHQEGLASWVPSCTNCAVSVSCSCSVDNLSYDHSSLKCLTIPSHSPLSPDYDLLRPTPFTTSPVYIPANPFYTSCTINDATPASACYTPTYEHTTSRSKPTKSGSVTSSSLHMFDNHSGTSQSSAILKSANFSGVNDSGANFTGGSSLLLYDLSSPVHLPTRSGYTFV